MLLPSRNEVEGVTKWVKRGVITVGVAVLGFTGWFSFTETIAQGHVGVVYNRSHGVEEQTLGQGLHFVNPLERITEYPVSTETVNYSELSLATKDGKPLTADITYDYFNDVEKTPYIYDKFKGQKPKNIEENWLKARLKDSALSVTSKYTILEVFQKREEISKEIEAQFQKDVKKHGFLIENVVFGTPKPDAETAKAIQAVVNRQQELEALKIEKQKAELEAEKKMIQAKGDAEAALVKSEAQAKANNILNKSLTPTLLELKKVEKWDGVNSTHVLGDAGVNINTK